MAENKETSADKQKARTLKKRKVYVCSNGAVYNKRNDAEEYQKVLDASKEIEEKEV